MLLLGVGVASSMALPLGYRPNIIFNLVDDFGHYNSGWVSTSVTRNKFESGDGGWERLSYVYLFIHVQTRKQCKGHGEHVCLSTITHVSTLTLYSVVTTSCCT